MSRRPIIATLAAAAALAVPTALGVQGAGATSTRHAAASQATAPYENPNLSVRKRVADLLSRMTLQEKIGQMTQAERQNVGPDGDEDHERHARQRAVGRRLGAHPEHARGVGRHGRLLPEGRAGDPAAASRSSTASTPSTATATCYGATVFPHNIGLGATRDPALVQQVEHIAAEETRATGPQWAFAPCICAARDDRWGRTYESFGEDPKLVEQDGDRDRRLPGQGRGRLDKPDRVLATAKHYAGDGDTDGTAPPATGDYKIDQGVAITQPRRLLAASRCASTCRRSRTTTSAA